jgi:hypothetical protein
LHTVIFIHYDQTLQTVTVEDGKTVADPGIDSTLGENVRWDGWTLEGVVFDFSTPIVSDISLKAKGTPYENIKCQITVQPYEGYRHSEGELVHAQSYLVGGYKSTITLDHVYMSTLGYNVTAYNLYDSKGVLIKENVVSGDSITFDEESMTLIPTVEAKEVSISYNGGTAESVLLKAGFTISDDVPTGDEGQVFIGWNVENDPTGEVFQKGEFVSEDSLVLYGSTINFVPVFKEDVVSITSWDELITDQDYDSDAVLSIDADIDAGGEDSGTGIGDGDFSGIILGNGHTISNFTIDIDDDEGTGVGLIDCSGDGFQCYDLTIDNASYYNCAMYSAGVLVGEIDDYSIIKNVTIKDCSTAELTDYYNKNQQKGYGVNYQGGIFGCVFHGALAMVNCTVDNFTCNYEMTYADTTESPERGIEIGGLIGSSECGNDAGVKIQGCTVKDSTLISPKHSFSIIGGLLGEQDEGYGLLMNDNKVINTTISATETNSGSLTADTNPTTDLGGLVGNFSLQTKRHVDGEKIYNPINNNVVEGVKISYTNTETTDLNSIYAAGMFGEYESDGNGDGAIQNTQYTALSGNKISADINIVTATANKVHSAGLFGEIDTYSTGNSDVFVDNTYVNVNQNISVTGQSGCSIISGLIGEVEANQSSGVDIDDVVILGSIKAPDTDYASTYYVGGIIGYGATAEALMPVSHCYVNLTMGMEKFSSFVCKYDNNVFGEVADAIFNFSDLYVSSTNMIGSINNNLGSIIEVSATNTATAQVGLSSSYWTSDANGEPVLK